MTIFLWLFHQRAHVCECCFAWTWPPQPLPDPSPSPFLTPSPAPIPSTYPLPPSIQEPRPCQEEAPPAGRSLHVPVVLEFSASCFPRSPSPPQTAGPCLRWLTGWLGPVHTGPFSFLFFSPKPPGGRHLIILLIIRNASKSSYKFNSSFFLTF